MLSRYNGSQMHIYTMRLSALRPKLIAVHHADTSLAITAAIFQGGLLHGSWADASWWTTSTWTEGGYHDSCAHTSHQPSSKHLICKPCSVRTPCLLVTLIEV
jgi:hypothetical protein